MCNLMLASLALTVSLTTAGLHSSHARGTKNKNLKYNPDGSLTIYVQADAPPEAQPTNWLPAPKAADFWALHSRLLAEDARAKRFMDAPRGAARELMLHEIRQTSALGRAPYVA